MTLQNPGSGMAVIDDFSFTAGPVQPEDGTQKWAFLTGANVESSPAIGADGTLYVGSSDFNLYAINPDGTQKWGFPTGGFVFSSPAIGTDGTVYVGSSDGYLYAINPDGTQKWAFTTGDFVSSPPAIGADGTLYVGSNDDNLYAINGSSGGLSSDAPWPMFHRDLQHTGQANCPLPLGDPSYCTECGPCGWVWETVTETPSVRADSAVSMTWGPTTALPPTSMCVRTPPTAAHSALATAPSVPHQAVGPVMWGGGL